MCRHILTCGEISGEWMLCLAIKLSRLFTPLDAHKFKLLHVTIDMVFQGWLFLMCCHSYFRLKSFCSR